MRGSKPRKYRNVISLIRGVVAIGEGVTIGQLEKITGLPYATIGKNVATRRAEFENVGTRSLAVYVRRA